MYLIEGYHCCWLRTSDREQVHRRHADGSASPRRRITSVPFPLPHLVATALIRQTSIVSYQSALTGNAPLRAAACDVLASSLVAVHAAALHLSQ